MTSRNGHDLTTSASATYVDHRRRDGVIVRWGSRRHRKHLEAPAIGSTWWAPRSRDWWIAILFAIGSVLFGLGVIPPYAAAVGTEWDNATFFIGSVFFTAAAFLSYREAVDAAPRALNPAWRRVFVFRPGRIDWWATGVQFIGTLFFNVSTGTATVANLSARVEHQHVWRPDTLGSACFLASSFLAWYEVCHGWAAWRPREWSWWITLANLIGSVAFGISAVAAYVNPVTGQVRDVGRANLGTLVGAVCFLIGAVLLLPERTEDVRERATHPTGS